MINKIEIKNFKSAQNLSLDLSKLNIFTGLNSSGKSTIIQCLLLLRQTYQQNNIEKYLSLNGSYVNIGTIKDAFCNKSNKEDKLSIVINETFKFIYKNKIEDSKQQSNLFEVVESEKTDYTNQVLFSDDKFMYLGAERIAPKAFYPMSYNHIQNNQLGNQGEYTSHFLKEYGSTDIPIPQLLKDDKNKTLIAQVIAWLKEITTSHNLKTDISNEMNLSNLLFNENIKITNVGFGLSYILPILTTILFADAGSLIIIENPESHLHPKGQLKLGELIAKAAMNGIQIIIETHSDHLLQGIKRVIKEDEECKVYYFEQDNGITQAKPITHFISTHLDNLVEFDFFLAQKNIAELINSEENQQLEFKSTLITAIGNANQRRIINEDTNSEAIKGIKKEIANKDMTPEVMKAIASIANTEGGYVVVGISEGEYAPKEIIGLEKDYDNDKIQNNIGQDNRDKFTLYFDNKIKDYFSNTFQALLQTNIETYDGKDIFVIKVQKSEEPVFLKQNGKESFYIRRQKSKAELVNPSEMIKYIREHFK